MVQRCSYLKTTYPEIKSSLNITTGATVYFVNLTCSGGGGALYGTMMLHIAKVVFMYNSAESAAGGAVHHKKPNSTLFSMYKIVM